ncbi:MAG: Unknown protein [uncultured Sulfurovum sp.]|uniref:Uncharacterized protein n=1 Tax=uncultured Sulfurovum sp. TaxID=269237 RepID=A0A6S6U762_9BACT|nr:MAG: Unknown protein [uncultured Sulfurovum sp.]
MQLFFSTISELIESFKLKKITEPKMQEYLSFAQNKLEERESTSLGFFKLANTYENVNEKLMYIFLENKKDISADDLKALGEHIDRQQKNSQIQRKVLYQFIISVILLGISIPLISNPELKEFGFSTIGMVIGYWLK